MVPYSNTIDDLLLPERRGPTFNATVTGHLEAVAIEAARLSYYRFEDVRDGPRYRQLLEVGMGHAGFSGFEYFEATVPGTEVVMLPNQPFRRKRAANTP